MSQGYRIEKFAEIEDILNRVRDAHEAEAPPAVEDRVEKARKRFVPDAPAHRVDASRQFTQNLANGPFDPERLGKSRYGAGRVVVKAEPHARDYDGVAQQRDPSTEGVGDFEPHHDAVAEQHGSASSEGGAPAQLEGPFEGQPEGELPEWFTQVQNGVDVYDAPGDEALPAELASAETGEEPVIPAHAENEATLPMPKRSAAPADAPPRHDLTQPGFAYPEGGQFMADFGPGHVEVGEGQSFEDANRTRTLKVNVPEASATGTKTAIVRRRS